MQLKKIQTLVVTFVVAFSSLHAMAQERISPITLRGNIGVVSDYLFRGISQSDEGPVLQGGLDLSFPKGFYAGAWASGVDMPWGGVYNQRAGEEDFEYDLYLGWTEENHAGTVRIDTGIIRYAFSEDPDDLTWIEYYVGLVFYNRLRFKVSKDIDGPAFGTYFDVGYRHPVKDWFDLNAHFGHFKLDDRIVREMDRYSDFSVGVGKNYKGIRFELTYHRTDRDARARYLDDVADDRFVFAIKKQFELFPNFRLFK